MNILVFAVYDNVAKAYANPFYMQNKGMAIRAFADSVNAEEENNLSKHPENFSLYQVAEWDDHAGTMTPVEKPVLVVTANEVRNPRQKEELAMKLDAISERLDRIIK